MHPKSVLTPCSSSPAPTDIERTLRAFLAKISVSDSMLVPNPPGLSGQLDEADLSQECTFHVLAHLEEAASDHSEVQRFE